ncbi:MAG: S53 family peptidase [Candidatus Acidiferrales bacterium]
MKTRTKFAPLSPVILSAAIALLLFSSAGPASAGWHGRAAIVQAIDESRMVTLDGNTRGEANAENDRGRVRDDTPMEHMMLQLKRSPESEQALDTYIDELSNHNSANFHQWLTATQLGETYGVSEADLKTVTNWLESKGFTVNLIYPNRMVIDFSGTARDVRRAFRCEIHHLDVDGVKHIANMSDPQIPAALAPVVAGIVSLHDFKPRPMYKPKIEYTFAGGNPSGSTTDYAAVPGDLATIYNLNPLFSEGISGQGQTIVVIEDTDVFTTADWTNFRAKFGLSNFSGATFTQVHPPPPSGPNNCTDPGVNGDDGEAILDAEWASAAAPSAAIEMVSCPSTGTGGGLNFGGFVAFQNLVNAAGKPPAIISMSYGECEAANGATANLAYSMVYQQAVTAGVSVFVSSGDEGAASCDANQTHATHGIGVSGFASTPYNVAVGGTDFADTYLKNSSTYWNAGNSTYFNSALSYIPEIPWNDSCASVLFATHFGYATTYGTGGFCNNSPGNSTFRTVVSGSGGPSGCATGTATTAGVVSGTCAGWAKPSWQSVYGNPSDGVRDIPDVSLFAANNFWGHYYVFCWTDTGNGGGSCSGAPSSWPGAGGTSFSSPIMAGIQALVNQRTNARQGNPNTVYYMIAATEYGASVSAACNSSNNPLRRGLASTCTFYDVTLGDIDVNCTGANNCYHPTGANGVLSTNSGAYDPAFVTTAGWDFATGIGTVNAYNLVYNTAW